jgi:hypothetical protein
MKLVFGIIGAIAYEKNTNLFDNLMFSKNAPLYVVVSLFIFTSNINHLIKQNSFHSIACCG